MEVKLSSPHKDDVVKKAFPTINGTHTLCTDSTSGQSCLVNNMHDVSRASTHKVNNSRETEEHTFYTVCEDSVYHVPSSNEQKIYEDFEGKGFHKLHHKDIV